MKKEYKKLKEELEANNPIPQKFDWEEEEWGGWKIVGDMLNHPDKNGIYPTSKCYKKLYNFVISQKEKALSQFAFVISQKEKALSQFAKEILEVVDNEDKGFVGINRFRLISNLNSLFKRRGINL